MEAALGTGEPCSCPCCLSPSSPQTGWPGPCQSPFPHWAAPQLCWGFQTLFLRVSSSLGGRPNYGQRVEKPALKAGDTLRQKDGLPQGRESGQALGKFFSLKKPPALGLLICRLAGCRTSVQTSGREAEASSSDLGPRPGAPRRGEHYRAQHICTPELGNWGLRAAFSGFRGRNSGLIPSGICSGMMHKPRSDSVL